jgi:hypothetical protein
MSESPVPVTLFISYSHRDARFRRELETHLALLQHQGVLDVWHDRRILPGQEWATEIDARLDGAQLVLFLVSPDFVASKYCYGFEMKRVLDVERTGKIRAVPVIVRPVDWETSPLGRFQALPRDGRPINLWRHRDEAWKDVAQGVRSLAAELRRSITPAAGVPSAPVAFRSAVNAERRMTRDRGKDPHGSIKEVSPDLGALRKGDYGLYVTLDPDLANRLRMVVAAENRAGDAPATSASGTGRHDDGPATALYIKQRFRAISDWCVARGVHRAGWPNFHRANYGDDRGDVYGHFLLQESVAEWRDVASAEYDTTDLRRCFTSAFDYAVRHGYQHGFPNFHEAGFGQGLVYGTFLVPVGKCEFRDVPAKELALTDPAGASMDAWFRGAGDYAVRNAFAAGMPTGHYADNGDGPMCGIVLFPSGNADWADIPGSELGLG